MSNHTEDNSTSVNTVRLTKDLETRPKVLRPNYTNNSIYIVNSRRIPIRRSKKDVRCSASKGSNAAKPAQDMTSPVLKSAGQIWDPA